MFSSLSIEWLSVFMPQVSTQLLGWIGCVKFLCQCISNQKCCSELQALLSVWWSLETPLHRAIGASAITPTRSPYHAVKWLQAGAEEAAYIPHSGSATTDKDGHPDRESQEVTDQLAQYSRASIHPYHCPSCSKTSGCYRSWSPHLVQAHAVDATDVHGRPFDRTVIEWALTDISRIYRMCLYTDRLQSRVCDPNMRHHRRYRLKKALCRARERIKNLVVEVHRKLAKFLCEVYDVILLPRFGTSGMVCRGRRKIQSKTVRQLLGWSHYAFQQCLRSKAREYPWVRVLEVREDYTSKTCGHCGTLHHTLGGSKRFVCPTHSCGLSVDRDLNGARNILLRWLSSPLEEEAISNTPETLWWQSLSICSFTPLFHSDSDCLRAIRQDVRALAWGQGGVWYENCSFGTFHQNKGSDLCQSQRLTIVRPKFSNWAWLPCDFQRSLCSQWISIWVSREFSLSPAPSADFLEWRFVTSRMCGFYMEKSWGAACIVCIRQNLSMILLLIISRLSNSQTRQAGRPYAPDVRCRLHFLRGFLYMWCSCSHSPLFSLAHLLSLSLSRSLPLNSVSPRPT